MMLNMTHGMHMGHNMTDHNDMMHTGHNNMTGAHSGHNHTHMTHGHSNMTDMHHGHNMTDMHHGHNMTGAHIGHNMTDMHHGHNMTAAHNCLNMTGSHNHNGMTPDMHRGHAGADQRLSHGTEHNMKMYFHTGNTEYVLFEDLYTSSNGGLIGACAVVFVVAVLYEALKVVRESLLQRSQREANRQKYSLNMKELDGGMGTSNVRAKMCNGGHFLQVLLHMLQTFISYCLMLVFMTFNVWLCLAVIVGAGTGYFLFGWKRNSVIDNNEHCH